MITDINIQHELLKTALEATDNYLGVEKKAKAAGMATNAMVHDFSYFMTQAHQALQSLGVLDQHQAYMEKHVEEMLRLHGHKDKTIGDLPYAHVPAADFGEVEEQNVWDKKSPVTKHEKLSPQTKAKAKARAKAAGRPYPNMVDNIWAARQQEGKIPSFSEFITEEKQFSPTDEEIQKIVDSVEWEDMVDLYEDEDLIYEETLFEAGLTAQARLRKRQSFARMRSKRGIAKRIKLRRASTPEVLKKRAVVAARNAIYRRLLRGRDKSKLSAAEKTRIEQQVKRLKSIQSSLVPRLLPKMRSIEQKRLAHYRTGKK